MYPLSNLMPSTSDKVVSLPLLSSIVITPSFPTCSIASPTILPTSTSLPEIVATKVICSFSEIGFAISRIRLIA